MNIGGEISIKNVAPTSSSRSALALILSLHSPTTTPTLNSRDVLLQLTLYLGKIMEKAMLEHRESEITLFTVSNSTNKGTIWGTNCCQRLEQEEAQPLALRNRLGKGFRWLQNEMKGRTAKSPFQIPDKTTVRKDKGLLHNCKTCY